MRIKYYLSLSLLLLIFSLSCYGQGGSKVDVSKKQYQLPQKKYKANLSTPYSPIRSMFRRDGYNTTYMASYHSTLFLNPKFAGNIENSSLEAGPGYSLGLKLEYFIPVSFDLNWFSSSFIYSNNNNSSSPLLDGSVIKHRGIEIAANLTLLPANKYFLPYVGLGYQTASLVAGNEYYSNCSAAIWKAGIMLGLPSFFLMFEYKQSLNPNAPKAFNQLSIGAGLRAK